MRRSFESIENISEIKEDFNKLNEGQKDKVEINGQTIITKDEYKKLKKNGIILNNNNVLPYTFSIKSPDILFSYLSKKFSDIKNIIDFSAYNLENSSIGRSKVKEDYWNQINSLKNSNDDKIHVVLRTLKFYDDKNLKTENLSIGHLGFAIIVNGKVYHFDTIGSCVFQDI